MNTGRDSRSTVFPLRDTFQRAEVWENERSAKNQWIYAIELQPERRKIVEIARRGNNNAGRCLLCILTTVIRRETRE